MNIKSHIKEIHFAARNLKVLLNEHCGSVEQDAKQGIADQIVRLERSATGINAALYSTKASTLPTPSQYDLACALTSYASVNGDVRCIVTSRYQDEVFIQGVGWRRPHGRSYASTLRWFAARGLIKNEPQYRCSVVEILDIDGIKTLLDAS